MPVASNTLDGWKIIPRSIDYKKLTPEDFPWANFDQTPYTIVEPNEKGYVSDALTELLITGKDRKETCIINIGVGRGKTTAAYGIINYYYQQEEFIIIVVAPFKKLTERDFEKYSHLSNVVHYEMLDKPEVEERALKEAKVHFITINTLIGNPGEDNFVMTRKKRLYIDQIQSYCAESKKKVVFIFDELHAGINVFSPEFAMNLWGWKGITHKSYLLSATFTESSKMVIDYFAGLTDYNLKIYETKRAKFTTQSKLHLFLTGNTYSSSDLTILDPIAEIIKNAKRDDKRIHIITAYRDLAKAICAPKGNSEISKAINDLDYNLLVGGRSRNRFDREKSNIGTTFYTGIDFQDENDILILILPPVFSKDDLKAGGIFSNGKVAINQAIARLRTGGDIYVVMPKPKVFLNGGYIAFLAKNRLYQGEERIDYILEDKQPQLLREYYNTQRKKVQSTIDEAERQMETGDWNDRAPLRYQTFGEFLLDRGDQYLVNFFESFGKGYSPYVLWAAFHDQFENTTLTSLTTLHHEITEVHLNEESLLNDLQDYYGESLPDIIEKLKLHDAYETLVQCLKDNNFKTGKSVKTKIFYKYRDGKQKEFGKDDTQWPLQLKIEIVNLLHLFHSGIYLNISADEYVRLRIDNVMERYFKDDSKPKDFDGLDRLYLMFNDVCSQFFHTGLTLAAISLEQGNKGLINAQSFPDKICYPALALMKELKSKDLFFHRYKPFDKLFRILPDGKIKMPEGWQNLTFEPQWIDDVSKQISETKEALNSDEKKMVYDLLKKLVYKMESNYKTKSDDIKGFKLRAFKKSTLPR